MELIQTYTLYLHSISATPDAFAHINLTLVKGDSVHAAVKPYCDASSLVKCEKMIDAIYGDFHGRGYFYAPSLPTASFEDFTWRRGDVVKYYVERFGYEKYLEIGTATGNLFKLAQEYVDVAVGVDPTGVATHQMTSDEFFKSNQQYFDLVFIDGLHEANQVFRDIQNSLRWLTPNGTILIHDCNPKGDPIAGSYPRHPDAYSWVGDVWKAVVAYRMDPRVEVVVLDVDMGIGVIRRRENTRPLAPEWREFLSVNPISMLHFEHLVHHRDDIIRMVTLKGMREWLQEELR